MDFTQAEVTEQLDRLRRDLRATGHGGLEWIVAKEAQNVATFATDATWYVSKVVEDVQQRLQDEHIDTTWPACPRHPNHPLDYVDGSWRCPRDGAAIAGLGQLPQTRAAT